MNDLESYRSERANRRGRLMVIGAVEALGGRATTKDDYSSMCIAAGMMLALAKTAGMPQPTMEACVLTGSELADDFVDYMETERDARK